MNIEDYKGKSTVEILELNRSKEWVDVALVETNKLNDDKHEAWSLIMTSFLAEHHPEQAMIAPLIAQALVDLVVLFLKLGYLKGKQVGEDAVELEKIWKEN